jgi:hypothetical protein
VFLLHVKWQRELQHIIYTILLLFLLEESLGLIYLERPGLHFASSFHTLHDPNVVQSNFMGEV